MGLLKSYSGTMKKFYTYEQQLDKLKSKGLVIKDESAAIEVLKREGYYNIINGYSSLFKNDSKMFYGGTEFDDIVNLYDFDKNLRSIVYKYSSSIECNCKALIAHEFSRAHGVDEKLYLTAEAFTPNKSCALGVSDLIAECNKTIAEALNKNSNKYREYIAHNLNTNGHVPMWVLIRALTFGTTTILYKYMLPEEKEAVSSNFKLTAAQLENILEIVVPFRNIVAHGERTYCARLIRKRLSTKLPVVQKLGIPKNEKGENKYGRNDFLALMICFKYLLPAVEFSSFMYEFNANLEQLSTKLSPSLVGEVKVQMGLRAGGWRNLIKIKI